MVTSSRLVELHVKANLGVYFDETTRLDRDLSYVSSRRIADWYWNYGYATGGRGLSERDLCLIASAARRLDRRPAAWQKAGSPIPPGWKAVSSESWMVCAAGELGPQALEPPEVEVRWELVAEPTPAMQAVFLDAYGSGDDPGAVGYSSLPPEYAVAYLQGRVRPPAVAFHVFLEHDAQCVAVASVTLVDHTGGIYSVATPHRWRRRGLGRYVSAVACRQALSRGATHLFLQTEAQSAVQTMYEQIGFRSLFVGQLLSRDG